MMFAAAAILIVGVIAFTLLIRERDIPEPEPVSPTAHLEERRRNIYESLRDLQFEYRMDKLSDQDYQETKTELQRQLAVVLAEIEQVQKGTAKAKAAPARQQEWVCPKCSTSYSRPMKFCGECGQAIPAAS